MKHIQIAIDGPVAAGKGTIAALIAKKRNLLYVDTGAMYRAVALLGMRSGVDLSDEQQLLRLLEHNSLTVATSEKRPGTCDIYLNQENVSEEIRTPKVSWGSSVVATHPAIRNYLVAQQREIAKKKSVVMEGRDIGLRVLPDAKLKIFLTADQTVRARRRKEQLAKKGIQTSYSHVLQETRKRDQQDMHRSIDPLQPPPGALIIDTTDLTIDEVVAMIVNKLDEISK
ncbi:(d)CMP kinase [Candidatus Roizmanbacteria bacterium]|nr:(d)CMP kinase [Candidatus Roizmanbacteria bacterium]